YVVRTPGSDLAPESLMEFVAARVAPHKKIRLVEFIDQVPRSTSGKIFRKELAARA
ncbi:MAG: AMP-binding enzyme, partial [Blastococcus sp.]